MTERGRATRAKLIDATLSVVRDIGYAHASTRAIAEAAGVAEGTIYRHFPDKAHLFFAAAVESNAPAMAWVAGLPARAGQGTVESNLTEALRQLAALQERIVPLELAMLGDPELAAQRQRALAASDGRPPGPPESIAAYLAAEQRLGRVRADVDPVEAAIVILAALFGLALTPGRPAVALEPDRVGAVVRLLVRGMASEAATRIDRGSTATTAIYSIDGDLTYERTFDAPRDLVWRAMTDPTWIPRWWGPHGTTTTVIEMDVRPGGTWRYVSAAPDRDDVAFYGEYLEINPIDGYRWTFMFDVEGAGPMGGPEAFRLEDLAGKTRVTVTSEMGSAEAIDGALATGMVKGAIETWDRLEVALAEG